ncbi:MAG: serine/threonine-protein kinase [Phormidesmis sp.]
MIPSTMSKPIIPNGTLIDNRYLIQKLLGQGGLGRTYLAFDTRRFNEACVLKEFAPSGSGKHSIQKSRSLFKREAEILYHIQHPQIPDFLACFEEADRLFLVQEYVNGKTYSDLLKARRKQHSVFSEQEVIDWLNNLLTVLDYVHQCSIIHRDISPDNIMLPADSHLPVLIDFGVGKQIVEAAQLTNSGDDDTEEISYVGKMSLVGKVGYAPHEQIRLGVCSPSSDLYALGVTAVVLLTCKDPSALMNQYSLKWEWRTYAQVSDAFGQIIDKMLADTPADRYQTAPEVSGDLAQLAAGTTSPSLPDEPEWPSTAIRRSIPQTVISPAPDLGSHFSSEPIPYRNELATNGLAPDGLAPEGLASPIDALSPAFIERCQTKLAEYIGPMAMLVIDEAIAAHRPRSQAALVDLLVPEIPSSEEANAFRTQLLR